MSKAARITRRALGSLSLSLMSTVAVGSGPVRAATPDGAGAVKDMLAVLQAANALSFTFEAIFGASVAKDKLKTLGNRASVVFQRPDSLFAAFGSGGETDVQMVISGGEATLFRLSLATKTTLRLVPENGSAFMVPGLFLPFLGLVADDPQEAFFGGISSVTAIAQGLPDQPEQTSLAAVMGGRFTGEVWVDKSTGLPARTNGTWFGSKGDVAASAALTFSDWSSKAPDAGSFSVKGLADAKDVGLEELGL